ncbi:MAG: hypothetical protein WBV82_02410, partial [Myxococcaceae bacterium]
VLQKPLELDELTARIEDVTRNVLNASNSSIQRQPPPMHSARFDGRWSARLLIEARGPMIDYPFLSRWLPPEHAALLQQAPSLDDEALVAALKKV